jgi:tetrathionate reductase subunit A
VVRRDLEAIPIPAPWQGQAGIQTAFDSYRIRKPMKRVGPRGSGEWKTISWEEAIHGIVDGDDELGTPGLEELWAYVPKDDVMADWEAVQNGEMDKSTFDERYEDALIDTDHPDLGPKANQIVDVGGFRRNFIGRDCSNRGWARSTASIMLARVDSPASWGTSTPTSP